MNNSVELLILFSLIIVLAGCGITGKAIDIKTNQTGNVVPDIPVQWIYFNDEKFVDGVQDNQNIYLYKKVVSLFVFSKDETAEL